MLVEYAQKELVKKVAYVTGSQTYNQPLHYILHVSYIISMHAYIV